MCVWQLLTRTYSESESSLEVALHFTASVCTIFSDNLDFLQCATMCDLIPWFRMGTPLVIIASCLAAELAPIPETAARHPALGGLLLLGDARV